MVELESHQMATELPMPRRSVMRCTARAGPPSTPPSRQSSRFAPHCCTLLQLRHMQPHRVMQTANLTCAHHQAVMRTSDNRSAATQAVESLQGTQQQLAKQHEMSRVQSTQRLTGQAAAVQALAAGEASRPVATSLQDGWSQWHITAAALANCR